MTISLRQGVPQMQRQLLLKAASVVLLVSTLPTTNAADCWIDRYGNRRCRLSLGARIAIAVCSVLAFIFVILALGFYRRRRIQRTNLAYVTAQQQQQPTPYGNPYGNQYDNQYQQGYASYPTNAPAYGESAQYQQQYPPPGQDYYNQHAPQGSYAPPSGPPPGAQQYAGYDAPRSPPPAKV